MRFVDTMHRSLCSVGGCWLMANVMLGGFNFTAVILSICGPLLVSSSVGNGCIATMCITTINFSLTTACYWYDVVRPLTHSHHFICQLSIYLGVAALSNIFTFIWVMNGLGELYVSLSCGNNSTNPMIGIQLAVAAINVTFLICYSVCTSGLGRVIARDAVERAHLPSSTHHNVLAEDIVGIQDVSEPPAAMHVIDMSNATCVICLNNLWPENNKSPSSSTKDSLPVKELSGCGHRFHGECIFRWIANNNTCPLCRKPAISIKQFHS